MGQFQAELRYSLEYCSDSGRRGVRVNRRKAEKYCFPLHTHSCGELPGSAPVSHVGMNEGLQLESYAQ